MKQLDSGYVYEVDKINKDAWHNLLLDFDDVSFYQTWSYGAISWGENNLSHVILKKDDEIVSIAQLRIVKLPLPKTGFAYLTWGPMWRNKSREANRKDLINMVRALFNEYVITRGYLLRVIPKQINHEEEIVKQIFQEEKYSWQSDKQQTVYIDLSPSIEDIKLNIRSKWRQTLNRALRQDLEFIEASNDEFSEIALKIVLEMKKRKKFVEFGTMEHTIAVNADLPEKLELIFAICKHEGEPVAVLAWFSRGKLGQPLIGATADGALKFNAAYPLWWLMVEYYKNQGASLIDLAGVNQERNPGGYLFKTGLAGKDHLVKRYIGQFDACENPLSSITFKTGMVLREHYRNSIIKINKLSKKIGKGIRKQVS